MAKHPHQPKTSVISVTGAPSETVQGPTPPETTQPTPPETKSETNPENMPKAAQAPKSQTSTRLALRKERIGR